MLASSPVDLLMRIEINIVFMYYVLESGGVIILALWHHTILYNFATNSNITLLNCVVSIFLHCTIVFSEVSLMANKTQHQFVYAFVTRVICFCFHPWCGLTMQFSFTATLHSSGLENVLTSLSLFSHSNGCHRHHNRQNGRWGQTALYPISAVSALFSSTK